MTAMDRTPPSDGYVPARSEAEAERLRRQARILEAATEGRRMMLGPTLIGVWITVTG